MKKLKVNCCNDCVLKIDSHYGPESICQGIRSKKHPFGREIKGYSYDIKNFKPDWCPLESGDILVSLTKNEE